ncbi:uncharacterized protein LOC136018416 [Lathamus discolor]|uniref:uncharacterized protein LOC136018416 n=1 Tax=Lathamus discolor TaxID=678569 RepID=UPI0032B7B588
MPRRLIELIPRREQQQQQLRTRVPEPLASPIPQPVAAVLSCRSLLHLSFVRGSSPAPPAANKGEEKARVPPACPKRRLLCELPKPKACGRREGLHSQRNPSPRIFRRYQGRFRSPEAKLRWGGTEPEKGSGARFTRGIGLGCFPPCEPRGTDQAGMGVPRFSGRCLGSAGSALQRGRSAEPPARLRRCSAAEGARRLRGAARVFRAMHLQVGEAAEKLKEAQAAISPGIVVVARKVTVKHT